LLDAIRVVAGNARMEQDISSVSATIQLSIAPVFLLVAIGSFLNVMTQRLGRVVDRARAVETTFEGEQDERKRADERRELRALDKRIRYANMSIALSAFAALIVAIDVALLFAGAMSGVKLMTPAAVLFIVAIMGLIGGLGFFLAEITVATRSLRVRAARALERER
jgi:hypothetical protein